MIIYSIEYMMEEEHDKGGRPRLYATQEEAKVMHKKKRKEWKEKNKYYTTCHYCGRQIKRYLLSRHHSQKVCREKQEELQKAQHSNNPSN